MIESICEIPLWNKAGEVVAQACVDEDDWIALARYRWWLHCSGYAIGYLGVVPGTFLHRAILCLPNGDPRRTDHINRDRLDCRRSNLRIVTQAQNNQNLSVKGAVRYRGVGLHRPSGLYYARATIDGRVHSLGYHRTPEMAAEVAAAFRARHMPYSEEALVA